jgi:RNA polymerase sigma-70 factor (ECF subfamily)
MLSSHKREQPAAVAEEKGEQEILLSAVHLLPPDRQELLILKFVDQLSNAEIAKIMGRTEGAIKSLYHRTLVALRQNMVNDEDDQEPKLEEKG